MRAYILNVGGPGNRAHNPAVSRFIEDHTGERPLYADTHDNMFHSVNIFLYLYFSAVCVSGGFG